MSRLRHFSHLLYTLIFALPSLAFAGYSDTINLTEGVTDISKEVFGLHMLAFWICFGIGVLVIGLIFWSMLFHRKGKRKAAHFHENILVEILWTVIPFIILIFLAVPATKLLINMSDTTDSELTVKVTGSQWKWQYDYLAYGDDKKLNFGFVSNMSTPLEQILEPSSSAGLFPDNTDAGKFHNNNEADKRDETYLLDVDNRVVIPAGQKVRFLITSSDVIHSWFVPAFAVKKDAIPDLVNEVWVNIPESKIGTYRGNCTELCGKGHAFMPIVVDVVSQDDFKAWLQDEKEKAAAAPDLTPFADVKEAMALGKGIYDKACAVCHGASGQGGVGPAFAGSDLATNPDRIGEHIAILLNGQAAMPSFIATLKPKEIAAVVTYERNAWSNDTGDLIQATDVQPAE